MPTVAWISLILASGVSTPTVRGGLDRTYASKFTGRIVKRAANGGRTTIRPPADVDIPVPEAISTSRDLEMGASA